MFSSVLKQVRLKISGTLFKSVELNLVDRFLIYAMVHKLSSVEHEVGIFWINKNNPLSIGDIKNLSTKMNYTDVIAPQTIFQLPALKDERKHSCLVS